MYHRFDRVFLGATLLTALVVMGGAYLGLSRWLGAHPYWMVQVAWIGVAVGVVLAILCAALRVPTAIVAATSVVFLGLSLSAAKYGKLGFAASYGEDRLAGNFWYFGSMAVAAALFLAIFVGLGYVGNKLSD